MDIFPLFFLSFADYWANTIHRLCQNEKIIFFKFAAKLFSFFPLELKHLNLYRGFFPCFLSSVVMRLYLKLLKSTLNISVVLQKPFTIYCFWLLLKNISIKNLKIVLKPNFQQCLLVFFVITHRIKIINFLKGGFKQSGSLVVKFLIYICSDTVCL